ncbi:MAG TPA: hypothetical protein VFS76_20770 [Pyrinomonadaceae bacterium]|nr:hypothetical protein [Pyrinomonadaceae bacterium]
MSKRLLLVCVCVFLSSAYVAPALGQSDYRRLEIFGGFSHNRVDVGPVEDFDPGDDIEFNDIFDEREGFNGFNASITGNFHRYWVRSLTTRTTRSHSASVLTIRPFASITSSAAFS